MSPYLVDLLANDDMQTARMLLERPSVERRLQHLREYELQRRSAGRMALWRTALCRLGNGLVALGERLRAGSAMRAASG